MLHRVLARTRAQLHLQQRRAFSNALNGTVGFVGVGNMGMSMAANLAKKGCNVAFTDINPDSPGVKHVKEAGGNFYGSLEEVCAQNLTSLVTAVDSPATVRKLYLGDTGIIGYSVKNGNAPVLIDCSTVDPKTALDVQAEASAKGMAFVDSPMSGGVPGASAGTLSFMVGGSDTDFELVKPVLLLMGANVYHCGGTSTGQAAKLCNNLILAATMLGTAEGFRLGKALGLDPATFHKIVITSTGRSWSSDTYCPAPGTMENVPSSRGYAPPAFMVDLMLKDVNLAQKAAADVGTSLPVTQFSTDMYEALNKAGYGDLDFGCSYEHLLEALKK